MDQTEKGHSPPPGDNDFGRILLCDSRANRPESEDDAAEILLMAKIFLIADRRHKNAKFRMGLVSLVGVESKLQMVRPSPAIDKDLATQQ